MVKIMKYHDIDFWKSDPDLFAPKLQIFRPL